MSRPRTTGESTASTHTASATAAISFWRPVSRIWLLVALIAAGIALRLIFVFRFPLVVGDSLIYSEIARNLLGRHVFGFDERATLIRLPGYPFFLAACFKLFGIEHWKPVMLVHTLFDIGTCFLVADAARRMISRRAAAAAFTLAILCPLTANYVATGLTETLEIFFTAAALACAVIAFDRTGLRWWALTGLATAGAILLRPDGGLVLGALGLSIVWQIFRQYRNGKSVVNLLIPAVVLGVVALAPLVPWGLRNLHTFGKFQPLPNTAAADPGEFIPHGWNRWALTWAVDYSSTEDVTFKVSGEELDIAYIPNRAFDSAEERQYVQQLLTEYNTNTTMTPELDRKFGELAKAKIHKHWLRFYVVLPVERAFLMWFRPRTELIPVDTHWWKFEDDPHDSSIAVAFGLVNLFYMGCALLGVLAAVRGTLPIRYLSLLIIYPVIRTVLLMSLGALEDRYTLECFPMVFVLGGALLGRTNARQQFGDKQQQ